MREFIPFEEVIVLQVYRKQFIEAGIIGEWLNPEELKRKFFEPEFAYKICNAIGGRA